VEARHLRADLIPASRFLPEIGRVHHGHVHFLPADGVHFFANDALDIADHPPAERHQRENARAERANHPRSLHQLVAGQLDIGRSLSQGTTEEIRHTHSSAKPLS